ncbi:MAG: hypothetical protein HUK25_10010, partial [Treponema sp.]|nr:hypothetical protein [Treponema sp.]
MLNSTICQNIALCLYGNAYVNEQIDISNYLCNSSNNYCKHITFGYFDNNNPKEKFTVLSKNPIEWFNEHKQKKSVFSLHYRKISQEDIKWAGFANAGGEWITKTENEAESTYWKSFWSVQDRDDPEK